MKFVSSLNDFLHTPLTPKEKPSNSVKDHHKQHINKSLGKRKHGFFKDKFANLVKRSIFFETLILILICAIVPIIVSNVINYESYKDTLEKNTVKYLDNIADNRVSEIRSTVNFLKGDILSANYYYNIKLNFPILVKFDNDQGNPAYVQAKHTLDGQLIGLTNSNPFIDGVILANRQGNILYETKDLTNAEKVHVYDSLKSFSTEDLMDNVYISDPFFDPTDNDRGHIFLFSPDNGFDNKFLTWIIFEIPIKNFVSMVSTDTGLGDTGEINMAKMINGKMLYLTTPRYLSNPKDMLPSNFFSYAMSNALEGHDGSGRVKDYRNVDVIAAWRYIPEISMGLVVKMDAAEAFAPIQDLWLYTIIIIFVTVICVSFLAFFTIKSATKPIDNIVKTLNQISQGNLGVVLKPQGNKELHELGSAINTMSIRLKEINSQLEKTKTKFIALYEASPELCRTIDSNGIILECNKSYAEHLGYSKDEIIGKSIFDHIAKASLKDLVDSFSTWKSAGKVTNREMWFKKKDGTTFPVLLSATPVHDADGNLLGSNTVIRDMTEIYKTKRDLEEEKTKRFLAIGELSSRIAHDLRNPLGVIKNTVGLMKIRNPTLDEKTIMNIARMERAILRMTHQIDEVLDYVTPKPLNCQNTKLSRIFASSMDRMIFPETVTVELPKNDADLTCDHEKLEIVFVNLITNAIQAMNNRGKIIIRLLDKENEVFIEVEDTGPGIPEDVLPKIFDPLFTTRQIGTGLGLPSCKSIVEKHHGTIEAKNSEKNGALFIIRLPKT